jgi:putative addiction module killer protein
VAATPTVDYYQPPKGRIPFRDWLEHLRDRSAKTRIDPRIARLKGDWKSVGDGVVEPRIDYGPGYRLYIGEDGAKRILLLCGGVKGTQSADIKRAKTYWAEDMARKNERN